MYYSGTDFQNGGWVIPGDWLATIREEMCSEDDVRKLIYPTTARVKWTQTDTGASWMSIHSFYSPQPPAEIHSNLPICIQKQIDQSVGGIKIPFFQLVPTYSGISQASEHLISRLELLREFKVNDKESLEEYGWELD